MRKSFHLTGHPPKASQQGYALFIVLMIMIVIALLVVTAIQSYNTEQRISTNDADRKLATSLAEVALREGENAILEFDAQKVVFANNCKGSIGGTLTDGLCASPNVIPPSSGDISVEAASDNAWERKCNKKLCMDTNGKQLKIKAEDIESRYQPRYIIEYISTDAAQGSTIYRVTAKAWGKNRNTVVILQSYVANE